MNSSGASFMMWFRICLIVTFFYFCCCKNDSIDFYKAENDLINSLFDGYNSNIRPKEIINGTRWNDSNFQVYMSLSLYSVMGIDEIEETMSTSMVFTIFWFDSKLSWNPADHNNISQIYLKASEVWKPMWFVANSIERDSETVSSKDWVPIYYKSDGRAMWQDRLPLKTACDVDTTYYPFDQQSCSILLQWYEFEIDVQILAMEDHLNAFKDNAMWELYNFSMHVQSTYPDFRVTYYFNRKPDHTIINVLFPVMLIALLGPLVFLLPIESGERSGYTITVLLSVSVYMIIISDQLPKSSNPMSLLMYVLFAWYVLCALIVVVVVLCSKIYWFGDSRPVPKLIKLFVRLVHCKCIKRDQNDASKKPISESSPCMNDRSVSTDEAEDSENMSSDEITWASVCRAIDKVAIIVFYILKIGFIVIFVLILN